MKKIGIIIIWFILFCALCYSIPKIIPIIKKLNESQKYEYRTGTVIETQQINIKSEKYTNFWVKIRFDDPKIGIKDIYVDYYTFSKFNVGNKVLYPFVKTFLYPDKYDYNIFESPLSFLKFLFIISLIIDIFILIYIPYILFKRRYIYNN